MSALVAATGARDLMNDALGSTIPTARNMVSG